MVNLGMRTRSYINLSSSASFKAVEWVVAKFGQSLTKYITAPRLYF